jgi:HAD superfamily hydrolase (TIGR01484 family)
MVDLDMGRPYSTEMAELDQTFQWSLSAGVDELVGSILDSAGNRMIAVGSGGSLTSAHFASLLHSLFTANVAQVVTPYELLGSTQSLCDATVLVSSAGGSNPDVLSCVEQTTSRYPRQLFTITTRAHSKLEKLLQRYPWACCHAFKTPVKKDGFLATNSLLATMTLLVRAYEQAFRVPGSLATNLSDVVHPGISHDAFMDKLNFDGMPVVTRPTIVVLHGGNTKPAAADFESRFTEAAFANVQLADFRNFAHGRHHWLAQHSDSSAVVSFTSAQDEAVAKRTLSLIPSEVPRLNVSVVDGISGALSAVCHSVYLAHIAGQGKQLDPGRPHVPTFGRKLYHLKGSPKVVPPEIKMNARASTAIERKSGFTIASLVQRGELDSWKQHYEQFLQRLSEMNCEAIVFDYDGTLCGPERRLEGPADSIVDRLKELLKAGVTIAIATGRGKSVREVLQKRIRSVKLRRRVLLGYHNGAEIGTLDDKFCPPVDSPLQKHLKPIAKQIQQSSIILDNAEVQAKGSQITIELHQCLNRAALYREVIRIVAASTHAGLEVVTSTHSIDILAPGVSKRTILKHLKERGISLSAILCVGDRGNWPGNDTSLLSHPLSLCVDEVSSDPATCWNISDSDQRYDTGTVELLSMLKLSAGSASFDITRIRP